MKITLYPFLLIALVMGFLSACDNEEDAKPQSMATFTASATEVQVGEEIQFTNTSQNATAFRWSFGDGTSSKEISPRKSYQSPGIFTVSLVATGEGGSTISNMDIKVLPSSGFVVENASELVALTAVQFTNTSQGGDSYLWSFGDPGNSTSTEENPTFTYLSPGTYTVSLTVTSEAGESTYSQEITLGAASAELYFIAYGDGLIQKLALDGSGSVSNVMDIDGMGGVGLAYDKVNGKIYFSDFETYPEGRIWRMNLDATGLEEIASNIGDPYGIALDVAAGKIYWVDDDGNVSRANLDGSDPEIGLINIPGGQLRAISLDPENGKIYFYEVYDENLYVANMDGTDPTVIVPGVYGYAIFVDTVNDKIYFDDQNDELLKVANLDGSDIQTIDDNGTRIYGMDIDYDNGKLYWSGRDSGELYRANLDGSDHEVLKSELSSPRGIFLRN